MTLLLRCLVLVLSLAATRVILAQEVVLGAVEELPPSASSASNDYYADEPQVFGVRVLFEKGSDGWRSYPADCEPYPCLANLPSKYPKEMKWSILFNGKRVGQLTARTPKQFYSYSSVGLQKVVSKEDVPMLGAKSPEFGGFTGAEVHRPLLANSRPYYKDPELWHVSQLSPNKISLLHNQFRNKFPKLCKNDHEGDTKLEAFPYKNDEVKVVKAYISRKGWIVARLELSNAIECDDTEAGFGLSEQWFVIDPQKAVRYLGTDMWLVDAGDYDNDGHSEVLFAINGDNRGGYKLFYDDFKKKAVFEYSYH